jgi:hypothetical protein
LTTPSYRYRRILFPLLAWVLAPHGGRGLVIAIGAIGLASVALSAASLLALPRAPIWLPLVVAVTPGVIASLMLGLSDSLALALILLAFAAAARRRWVVMVTAVALAALTKETSVLAAPALAFAPEIPGRARVFVIAVPLGVLAGWTTWVDRTLHAAPSTASQFTRPFVGWVHSGDTSGGVLLALLLAISLALGAFRARSAPHIRAYLLTLLVFMAVLATPITDSWVNTSRAVVAGLPLAAWAITTYE